MPDFNSSAWYLVSSHCLCARILCSSGRWSTLQKKKQKRLRTFVTTSQTGHTSIQATDSWSTAVQICLLALWHHAHVAGEFPTALTQSSTLLQHWYRFQLPPLRPSQSSRHTWTLPSLNGHHHLYQIGPWVFRLLPPVEDHGKGALRPHETVASTSTSKSNQASEFDINMSMIKIFKSCRRTSATQQKRLTANVHERDPRQTTRIWDMQTCAIVPRSFQYTHFHLCRNSWKRLRTLHHRKESNWLQTWHLPRMHFAVRTWWVQKKPFCFEDWKKE